MRREGAKLRRSGSICLRFRNTVGLGDGVQHPAGVACGHDLRRNVVCHDAPGADHRPLADRHTGEQRRVAPDPDVVVNGHGERLHDPLVALLREQGVAHGVDPHVGADVNVVADRHGCLVEDRQVEVSHEVVAHGDLLPEVAVERAVERDVAADAAEEPADDRLALLTPRRRQSVETEAVTLVKPVITGFGSSEILAGDDFTIIGTDLDLVKGVTLNGVECTFTADDSGQLTVNTVATSTSGKVSVTAANGYRGDSSSELTVTPKTITVV